jgi:hypothetical protein
VICAPIASAFFVADLSQIAHGMYCDFDDGFRPRTLVGHHMISVELCSTSSRLSLCSTLRASALTTPCAQLEGRIYVMAEEARPHFCVDRMRRQSYREDLVDAIGHPSALSPDAER